MATLKGDNEVCVSIYDYPEHLNPFSEDDSVGKLHFWNIGKKKIRSNSFSMAGLKDFRRTWSFKSFTKKGRREMKSNDESTSTSPAISPIMYRKPYEGTMSSTSTLNRYTTNSQNENNRYVYGGSITPLPRFRFQERGSLQEKHMDCPSPIQDSIRISTPGDPASPISISSVNGLKSHGSQTSLQSNNPFETSTGSVRASARKKRKAPPPPTRIPTIPDAPSIVVTDTSLNTTIYESKSSLIELISLEHQKEKDDIDIDHPSLNIELKIVEDDLPVNSTLNITEKDKINDSEVQSENIVDKIDSYIDTNYVGDVLKDQNIKEDILDKNLNEDNVNTVDESDVINKNNTEGIKDEVVEIHDITIEVPKNITPIETERNGSDGNLAVEDIPKENGNVVNIENTKHEEVLEDDVFKKVDIVTYKRRISLSENNDIESNIDILKNVSVDKKQDNDYSSQENTNKTVDESSINDNGDSTNDSKIVKCKVIDYHEKNIIHENARRRSEFFELDKVAEEDESVTVRQKEARNSVYQRRTVSDIKLLFDNPNSGETKQSLPIGSTSPNPIPKPRRSRVGSRNSNSSESIKIDVSENTIRLANTEK